MILHTPTMFVVVIAVSYVLAASTAFIAHRRHQDLFLWSLALTLHGAAYTLFGLRGQINDFLSIVVGNITLSSMLAVFGEGIYRFQQRPAPRWLLWSPLVVIGIGFSLLIDDQRARFALSGLVFSLQCIFVLVALAQRHRETAGRGQYVLAAGTLAVIGVLAFRALAVTVGGVQIGSFTESSAMQGYAFLITVASMLCFAFGFLTMNQERAELAAERATSDLKRSEEHYRLLIESANEGICVAQGGIIRFANPKLRDLLGCDEGELVGRPFADIVHPDDRELVQHDDQKRLLGQADDLKYPVRMATKHQGMRWFEVSGTHFDWLGQPATLNFMTDITDRKRLDERFRELAYHDALTGLPNRRLLMDQLTMGLAANKRSGKRGAILFMDLDNFKPLNDTHGHSVGDLLLVQVAERLKQTVRETDFVSRFGGDEFVVLLGELDGDAATARTQAMGVAEKIRRSLSVPYRLAARDPAGADTLIEHRCSVSIGAVVFPSQSGSEQVLLTQADAAMYQAKQAGRDTVRFFETAV